jgi:ComF family protein
MAKSPVHINARTPTPSKPPLPARFRRLAERALDVILPPQCLSCERIVERDGVLCPECWGKATFISPPICAACGVPLEMEIGGDGLCGACLRRRPAFERARAAMVYDAASRRLILALKHGDRTDGAPALGRWLAQAGRELVSDADLIAPVPLHWTRLFKRRFNQAALIAMAIARDGDRTLAVDLLVRTRRTPRQIRMSPHQRFLNTRGAFRVKTAWWDRIQDQRVLLIDDVLTTGATAANCAKALLRGGAAAVDVLTLARVVRPERE